MHVTSFTGNHDRLLTEAQAADHLNLSVRTLQAWRSRGFGPPFIRAGRAVRYRRADLDRWIEANSVSNLPANERDHD